MVLSQGDPLVRSARIKEVIKITRKQEQAYKETDALRYLLEKLKGEKFKLDCGHHVTFGYYLGNNITIYNGSRLKVICSQCSY